MWELDRFSSDKERVREVARLTLRHNFGLFGPVGQSDIWHAVKERLKYKVVRKNAIYLPDLLNKARKYQCSRADKVANQRLPAVRPFSVTVYMPEPKVTKP
jgi:hypothetical protein